METGLLRKILYISVGSICLVLGMIGLFLPVLPTTPFWLLTAYLYTKSSPRLYRKVMEIPVFGKCIRNYKEYKALPIKVKIISLSTLWLTISLSIYLIGNIYIAFFLIITAICVTWHILSYKTLRKNNN